MLEAEAGLKPEIELRGRQELNSCLEQRENVTGAA